MVNQKTFFLIASLLAVCFVLSTSTETAHFRPNAPELIARFRRNAQELARFRREDPVTDAPAAEPTTTTGITVTATPAGNNGGGVIVTLYYYIYYYVWYTIMSVPYLREVVIVIQYFIARL